MSSTGIPSDPAMRAPTLYQVATLQRSDNFSRLDPHVPLDAFIALGCALPTMLKGLENIGPIERRRAMLVQGCGAVGLAAIFLRRLQALGRSSASRAMQLALRWLAVWRIRSARYDWSRARHFRCSLDIPLQEEGLELVTRNVRYLLVGTWAGAATVPLFPFETVHKAFKIIGTTYASPENYYQAARLSKLTLRNSLSLIV
ncbi:hypothetical protein BJX99DRAFT_257329 [Aspergillus californicus]